MLDCGRGLLFTRAMDESQDSTQIEPTTAHPSQDIGVRLEYCPRVNFATQQYGIPLIDSLTITNLGGHPLTNIEASIELSNGDCRPWTGRIDRLDVGASYRLTPDGMAVDLQRSAGRTEAEKCELRVSARAECSQGAAVYPVDLLAYDQWPGTGIFPELIAAFVTPNMPQVAALLGDARTALMPLRGSDALDGYQSRSRTVAAQIAEACFNAVLSRGLGYVNPPASFDRDGQRVRIIDRLLREGMGSCLDLSLLLAGVWEQAGLHPLILVIEGHAMAAVWTHGACLAEPVMDDAAQLRNLVQLGEVVPVEATRLTSRGTSFAAAVSAATDRLKNPGSTFCAIDIAACRRRGVRPLPLRADGDSLRIDTDEASSAGSIPTLQARLDAVTLADRSAAPDNTARGVPAERVKAWQTRLLDLTLRNRLINFRETAKTVRLSVPSLAQLEDLLADSGGVRLHPKTDGDSTFLLQQLLDGHAYTTETPQELQRKLLEIWRAALGSIEETGANVLYLALGMLRWYETAASTDVRSAPLILIPITLKRLSAGAGYRYEMSLSEEPIKANVTLLEKLRTSYGLKTEGLDQFVEDQQGIDVDLTLRAFRDVIRDIPRWEIEDAAYIGMFSFSKFLMWRDLQDNMERLKANRLVKHLVQPNLSPFDTKPLPETETLDDKLAPTDLFCTRDADSSQMAAICAASEGRTFVLEGPPGTGKSQTIANLIADSLARGKRVLFVAEKMAALSVVRRRLEEDGLGAFCLELHSAKASKKQILEQLKSGMDETGGGAPARWTATAAELKNSRARLNTYVREMHAPRDSGESLYQVLGRKISLHDGARAVPTSTDIRRTSEAQLAAWRSAVSAVVEHGNAVHPPHLHPLRDVTCTDWHFGLQEQVRTAATKTRRAIEKVEASLAAFADSCGLPNFSPATVSRNHVESLAELSALVPSFPGIDVRLLAGHEAPTFAAELRDLVDMGKRRDIERDRLLKTYHHEFLDADHPALLAQVISAQKWPPPLRLVIGIIVRRGMRRWCKDRAPSLKDLRADTESARRVRLDSDQLRNSPTASLLGQRWKAGHPSWADIETVLAWCEKFLLAAAPLNASDAGRAWISTIAQVLAANRSQGVAIASAALVESWQDLARRIQDVVELLRPVEAAAFGSPAAPGWLPRMAETLDRWYGAAPLLNDWCSWRRTMEAAASAGLEDLVQLYTVGKLSRDDLRPAFERGYADRWFTEVANAVEAVRGFNAGQHGAAQERFRVIDREFVNATRHEVVSRLAAQAPSKAPQASPQSEMGILQRELQKRRSHLPTRRLIEAIPNLIARLKPCFLMSPLSVAQYLDAKLPPFDLVVFDEASQIPVWDAIGAIARGTEVVVVGDSRQLPPTSFFDTFAGDDTAPSDAAVQVEELESILSECNAAGVPRMDLKWHYRSRHESLIAFSNHHYYRDSLYTFPSPFDRSDQLGVTFRHVPDGVYDRGGSRTNRIEAERVVDEVVRHLAASGEPDSIGIVTFNQAQQTLIEDLLDARRRERPELDRFFRSDAVEPVFVKNLENVQGDERDTIIFSVGYGPDQLGRPSMNFGPLNQDGGERRLNVAITRAKKRLVVFSSLKSDQIDLRRTRAVGVAHFKTFLDYADRGPRAIAEAIERKGTNDFESGFEHAVCRALTDKGWSVDTQVGCAGYRIDLAVRDPDLPGRYLIGIECDGAAYHSGKTARDRDRLRQSVLEGLGWRIARVWSTDWLINSDRCTGMLEQAIRDAQAAPRPAAASSQARAMETTAPISSGILASAGGSLFQPPRTAAGARVETSELTRTAQPQKYKRWSASNIKHPPGDPSDPATATTSLNALTQIVNQEGPVVEDLVMRRLAEYFDIQRLTDRFRDRASELIETAIAARSIHRAGDALWPASIDPARFESVRIPGDDEDDRRDIKDVPLIERANACIHVLRVQFSSPREELEKETARLLGVQRLQSRTRELIAEGIDYALTNGRIIDQDGRLTAVTPTKPPDESASNASNGPSE